MPQTGQRILKFCLPMMYTLLTIPGICQEGEVARGKFEPVGCHSTVTPSHTTPLVTSIIAQKIFGDMYTLLAFPFFSRVPRTDKRTPPPIGAQDSLLLLRGLRHTAGYVPLVHPQRLQSTLGWSIWLSLGR